MYQKYKQQQKKKSTVSAKIFATIAIWLILYSGYQLLPKLWSKIEENTTINSGNVVSVSQDRYVWKEVTTSGTLSGSTDMLSYTNTLINDGKETIYIMSSSIDLNTYNGFVYVHGKIVKLIGKTFVMDIDAIWNSENQLNSIEIPSSDTTVIVPAIWLKIDVEKSNDISYTITWDIITLESREGSWSVQVKWFICETWASEKNCQTLQDSHKEGSFISVWGMTFAKWDNGTWFAHNSAWAWYLINSSSDSLLYKVSSVIIPINENYIKSLLPEITKLCGAQWNAWDAIISKDNLSQWNVTVNWCIATVIISETGEKISITQKPWATSNLNNTWVTTNTPTTGTTINNEVLKNTSPAPANTISWHVFTSTRWNYSIHYPSARITYNGINITENLWISWLLCYVRMDIKDYKDRDDTSVGPAIVIYECTSKEPSSTLANNANGYIFKTNADGTKLFFIKVLNDAWNSFASSITIQ